MAAIKGMNMNRQGQSCSSTSRVFVHASLHKEVTEELVKLAEALPIGAPWLKQNDVGPIVSQRQFDRDHGFHRFGEGRRCATAHRRRQARRSRLAGGLFIAPTVFDGVTPCDADRSRRDIRPGDVGHDLGQLRGHARRRSTASNTASPQQSSPMISRKAMETAERIEAGYVWINSSGRYIGAPYGGWKQSGIGEEECFDEIVSYTQVKNINMRW